MLGEIRKYERVVDMITGAVIIIAMQVVLLYGLILFF